MTHLDQLRNFELRLASAASEATAKHINSRIGHVTAPKELL